IREAVPIEVAHPDRCRTVSGGVVFVRVVEQQSLSRLCGRLPYPLSRCGAGQGRREQRRRPEKNWPSRVSGHLARRRPRLASTDRDRAAYDVDDLGGALPSVEVRRNAAGQKVTVRLKKMEPPTCAGISAFLQLSGAPFEQDGCPSQAREITA